MLRGIYTAASGMLVQSTNTDVISNNLANVDTPGYHRQAAHVRAFPDMLLSRIHQGQQETIGRLGTGAAIDGGRFSFHPGRIHNTANPLDVALVGHGFFSVNTPEGPRYTRDGRFLLNDNGWLVDLNGNQVRGENGPIHVGDGQVEINSRGEIWVDGQMADRLLMVEFTDREGLRRVGSSLYEATEDVGDIFRFNGTVAQGSVEMSNVEVVREMVRMIEVHRAYEANQKVVQAHDETLGKAVNEIAGR